MINCDFLKYTYYAPLSNEVLGNGFIGMYRYTLWNSTECVAYSLNPQLGAFVYIFRIAGTVGLAAAGLAFLLVVVEFCFFRVWCSRLIDSFAFSVASLGVGLTFIIYGSSFCVNRGCSMDTGTYFMIAAWVLYFVASILSCCGPKPPPLLRRWCRTCKRSPPPPQEEPEAQSEVDSKPDVESPSTSTYAPTHVDIGVTTQAPVTEHYAVTH